MRLALLVMSGVAVMSCGKSLNPFKSDKATPESYWNVDGVWKRVEDSPPTYVPVGYSGAATPDGGQWITDNRDGKRFFVPRQAVNGIAPGVLWADAIKNSGKGE